MEPSITFRRYIINFCFRLFSFCVHLARCNCSYGHFRAGLLFLDPFGETVNRIARKTGYVRRWHYRQHGAAWLVKLNWSPQPSNYLARAAAAVVKV